MGKHPAKLMVALTVIALGMMGLAAVAADTLIPAGTSIRVRLQETISSKTAQNGQEFSAVLDQPIVVAGKTVAAKGATVRGKVVRARASGRLTTPGELYLRLSSIEIGGKSYPLQTSSVGRKRESHKKRNIVAIGGGTAAGALIGGIAGGGKGAAIGAGVGAGAGTAGAAATGKKEVQYPVETPLTFRLTQAVSAR